MVRNCSWCGTERGPGKPHSSESCIKRLKADMDVAHRRVFELHVEKVRLLRALNGFVSEDCHCTKTSLPCVQCEARGALEFVNKNPSPPPEIDHLVSPKKCERCGKGNAIVLRTVFGNNPQEHLCRECDEGFSIWNKSKKKNVAHCYGTHCHVINMGSTSCNCICAKCKDAKVQDH